MTFIHRSDSLLNRLSQTSLESNDLTSTQRLVDQSISHFSEGLRDTRTLVAITLGSAVFQMTRLGVLSFASRMGVNPVFARPIASALALNNEVITFEASGRAFDSLLAHPQNQNLWSWNGPGGWREALPTSWVHFATLKFGAYLGHSLSLPLQHLMASTSMVAGQQLTSILGFTPRPQTSWFEQLLSAELMNIQLGLGMQLVHGVAPRFHLYTSQLRLREFEMNSFERNRMTQPLLESGVLASNVGINFPHILYSKIISLNSRSSGSNTGPAREAPIDRPVPVRSPRQSGTRAIQDPFQSFLEQVKFDLDQRQRRVVLNPIHFRAFQVLVDRALTEEMSQNVFEAQAIEIFRSDYIDKLSSQGGRAEYRTLSQLREDLRARNRDFPQWLKDWIEEDPNLLNRGGYRFYFGKEGVKPRQSTLESFNFMLGAMAHYESTLAFSSHDLYEMRPFDSHVFLLDHSLFIEMISKRFPHPPMGVIMTREVEPIDRTVIEMIGQELWPLVMSESLVEGAHGAKIHPFVEIFHDRYLHWGMLTSLDLAGRRLLNRISQVVIDYDPRYIGVNEDQMDAIISFLFRAPSQSHYKLTGVLDYFDIKSPNQIFLRQHLLRSLHQVILEECEVGNPHALEMLSEFRKRFPESTQ
ncbi:MAG: hypothetical protein JNK65_04665 [Deltaproteobacteria bacterium]|nr:hypothetical protein [Deltaproteobacteria bacterium]